MSPKVAKASAAIVLTLATLGDETLSQAVLQGVLWAFLRYALLAKIAL